MVKNNYLVALFIVMYYLFLVMPFATNDINDEQNKTTYKSATTNEAVIMPQSAVVRSEKPLRIIAGFVYKKQKEVEPLLAKDNQDFVLLPECEEPPDFVITNKNPFFSRSN